MDHVRVEARERRRHVDAGGSGGDFSTATIVAGLVLTNVDAQVVCCCTHRSTPRSRPYQGPTDNAVLIIKILTETTMLSRWSGRNEGWQYPMRYEHCLKI